VTANSVLIAGAGIAGLTAALALARRGIGVTLIEQAEKLGEAGAGIQLSPNATRVLVALGLGERLKATIVEPFAIRVRAGRSGREIATMRLDTAMPDRYGAPYWVIHRADLQKALIEAIADEPQIALMLGATVDGFAIDPAGVRARVSFQTLGSPAKRVDYGAAALIGADGLWSRLRALLGDGAAPRFAGRIAFRAIVPAAPLSAQDRAPVVNLWIGAGGHLVHYPVRAGAAVNIVAVCGDQWQSPAWSTGAGREEVLARFPAAAWAAAARELLATPDHWRKWALYDREQSAPWGRGPVTLLGDAAHPMLPFLAQGAAMAIEDAAVLARELARSPADYAAALRHYERERWPRTARVQREARRNDVRYHLRQPAAFIRDAMLRAAGGPRLLARYDWIYRWRP
jgi:salicylate hydroxylase